MDAREGCHAHHHGWDEDEECDEKRGDQAWGEELVFLEDAACGKGGVGRGERVGGGEIEDRAVGHLTLGVGDKGRAGEDYEVVREYGGQ